MSPREDDRGTLGKVGLVFGLLIGGVAAFVTCQIEPPPADAGGAEVTPEAPIRLTFPELAPDPAGELPDLSGRVDRTVSIEGRMIPWEHDGGRVLSFYLTPYDLACCFGRTPERHELIAVQLADRGGMVFTPRVITVTGRFHIFEADGEPAYGITNAAAAPASRVHEH